MTGKIILVTGSTDGVGRCVAEKLAKNGETVLIHGRDESRAESLARAIKNEGGKVKVYLADFSSLEAIRNLADSVRNDFGQIDVLVNNAGIGVGGNGPQREVSRDGYELRFAVNYLSGFLLTRLLLPSITRNVGRIVNVASVGQQAIDFEDVMLEQGYNGTRAYCQSKLAQIMFTFDLADELKGAGITANALHPATYMDTAMVRKDGIRPMSRVEDGADAILRLAVATEMEGKSGLYFDGNRTSRANAQAYDTKARGLLRELSLELTGISAN